MASREPKAGHGPAPDLDPGCFAARRERLFERIGDGVALVPAAPELLKSRDTEVVYRPGSDLFYLTGWTEPDSLALFTPHDPAHRFTLFVRPRDAERERWSGLRLGVEGARSRTGADAVYPIDELEDRLPALLAAADRIHLPIDAETQLQDLATEALLRARRTRQRSGHGPAGLHDLEPTMGELRLVKDASELDRLRVAAAIAVEGHLAAIGRARPNVGEWEIQAALEGTFRAHGAAGPAFPSVIGAGANATVLHYGSNRSRAGEGDLILVDAGAEWGMYCADITRTFPASGRFTEAQREMYEIVLAAEEAAIARTRPDSTIQSIHEAAVEVLTRGMLQLGLLRGESLEEAIETGSYKRFYPHQTSHWLGLDVHDAGPYRRGAEPVRLEPGMVLTIEPGLYVPADAAEVPEAYRGVGIRIEDDAVVTEDGCELLTRGVPVSCEEIEALMAGESPPRA